MQHRSLRQHRLSAPRRGLALATIALTLLVVTPELASSAGAAVHSGRAATHTQFAAKKKRRVHIRRLTLAQKRALMERYLAAHPGVVISKKTGKVTAYKYKAPAKNAAGKTTAKKTTGKKRVSAAAVARYRRAILARSRARNAAGGKRAAGTTKFGSRPISRPSSSSLSLPVLALYAIAPFLLMGVYLVGGDYLRRRTPGQRQRPGRRGSARKRGASLVITRASNR